jgi:hypothetical protein
LVFAQNNELPLLKSTGLGLLGFGKEITHLNERTGIMYVGPESFFDNVYGFTGDDFPGIGLVVKLLYWSFCVTSLGVIILAIVSLMNRKLMMSALISVFVEVFIGLGLVVLAFLCTMVPTLVYDFYYQYSTQYYILLIPLAVTLVMAILTLRNLLRAKRTTQNPTLDVLPNPNRTACQPTRR